MTEQIAEAPPWPSARITGVVYLLYFLTAIFAVLLVRGLVVSDDARATANNILAHESLFRSGFAIGLIGTALYVAVTALFYGLFKPVNRSLALLAVLFSLVGCAIQASGSLFQVAPLVVLGGSHYLSVFSVEQLQALALMFLKLNAQAGYTEIIFFGLFDIVIGYLIFASTFLPRFLGVLMMIAGLGWLTFMSPMLATHLSPYVDVLGFIAELFLMLWLLVMGVNVQRWKEQASAAGASIRRASF
jgi:Domain of unknown function (DUF4386)